MLVKTIHEFEFYVYFTGYEDTVPVFLKVTEDFKYMSLVSEYEIGDIPDPLKEIGVTKINLEEYLESEISLDLEIDEVVIDTNDFKKWLDSL